MIMARNSTKLSKPLKKRLRKKRKNRKRNLLHNPKLARRASCKVLL